MLHVFHEMKVYIYIYIFFLIFLDMFKLINRLWYIYIYIFFLNPFNNIFFIILNNIIFMQFKYFY